MATKDLKDFDDDKPLQKPAEDMELSENEGVDEEDLQDLPEAKANLNLKEDELQEEESEPLNGEDEFPIRTKTSSLANEPEEEAEELSTSEPILGRKEHTIDDLAQEEQRLPAGVEPSRPKSFMNFDEENPLSASQLPRSGVYERRRSQGSNRSKTLLLLVIALLVVGGSVYLLKGKLLSVVKNSPTPSPTQEAVEPTSTPTPSPTIDRSGYAVRVLNGTTTSGLAASVSSKLVSLGYKADKVGNATNSAFTQTVVRAKPSVATALIDQLIKDLSPDYQAASSSSALKESDSADAEVIIGTH